VEFVRYVARVGVKHRSFHGGVLIAIPHILTSKTPIKREITLNINRQTVRIIVDACFITLIKYTSFRYG